MNKDVLNNLIETEIVNSLIVNQFKVMVELMIQKLNDQVNIIRDNILKYALNVKDSLEFKQIDKVMTMVFYSYAKFTYEF